MTGDTVSALTQACDATLDCSFSHTGDALEAWPEMPAPTSSTTATLAVGDAFAVALTYAKGHKRETFVNNHPGGALGASFTKEAKHASGRTCS